MVQASQQVAANEWGTLTYFPEWKALELKWLANTRSMNDDGFRQTLELLANQGLQLHPTNMIIDAVDFYHQVADATFAWRDQHIIPLYNQAGVQRFAFLTTDRMPNTVEKGVQSAPDGPATFPTAWFETRDRLYAWLTA